MGGEASREKERANRPECSRPAPGSSALCADARAVWPGGRLQSRLGHPCGSFPLVRRRLPGSQVGGGGRAGSGGAGVSI